MALTDRKTSESIVEALIDAGAPHVVGVKLADQGCYISDGRHGKVVRAKSVKRIVDTTGAGDAFVAGFIAAILRGFDPFRAARVANSVAASCVSAVGASTAIKTLDEYL